MRKVHNASLTLESILERHPWDGIQCGALAASTGRSGTSHLRGGRGAVKRTSQESMPGCTGNLSDLGPIAVSRPRSFDGTVRTPANALTDLAHYWSTRMEVMPGAGRTLPLEPAHGKCFLLGGNPTRYGFASYRTSLPRPTGGRLRIAAVPSRRVGPSRIDQSERIGGALKGSPITRDR